MNKIVKAAINNIDKRVMVTKVNGEKIPGTLITCSSAADNDGVAVIVLRPDSSGTKRIGLEIPFAEIQTITVLN